MLLLTSLNVANIQFLLCILCDLADCPPSQPSAVRVLSALELWKKSSPKSCAAIWLILMAYVELPSFYQAGTPVKACQPLALGNPGGQGTSLPFTWWRGKGTR